MARIKKDCPTCGPGQPVEMRLEPVGDQPTTQMGWVICCKTCNTDHAPDSTELVADGRAWAKAKRDANDGKIVVE
jgi:hypothetical protein